jgi:hypothetical protein
MLVLLGGCDSASTSVQERFATVEPHRRVFSAPRKVVFEAAVQAVKDVGLELGRKSFAAGTIEGYAGIRNADGARDARQTTIQIRLVETDNLETRVELLVSEHTEGSFPGGVSEKVLREHSLYELYFAALQQILSAKGISSPPAKN